MRPLRIAAIVLFAVYLLTTIGIYQWMRERYRRGGPFPASQAGALLNPLRGLLMPVQKTLEKFHLEARRYGAGAGARPRILHGGSRQDGGPAGESPMR